MSDEDPTESPMNGGSIPAARDQTAETSPPAISTGEEGAPTSGRRAALRELRRELSDEDLKSPGVQKMLLDELERADEECEALQGYVSRYHDADKRAAVLSERLKTHRSIEVMFGVGVGVGGAIIGVSPSVLPEGKVWIGVLLGALLLIGATVARAVKR